MTLFMFPFLVRVHELHMLFTKTTLVSLSTQSHEVGITEFSEQSGLAFHTSIQTKIMQKIYSLSIDFDSLDLSITWCKSSHLEITILL